MSVPFKSLKLPNTPELNRCPMYICTNYPLLSNCTSHNQMRIFGTRIRSTLTFIGGVKICSISINIVPYQDGNGTTTIGHRKSKVGAIILWPNWSWSTYSLSARSGSGLMVNPHFYRLPIDFLGSIYIFRRFNCINIKIPYSSCESFWSNKELLQYFCKL